MNLQDVANIAIPEGDVRTIHDKDSRLLWGKLSYDTKYMGDSSQNGAPTPDSPQDVNVVTGAQIVEIVGKNLFDINSLSATGITVENGVVSGTAQAFNTAFGTTGVPLSLEEAQYTLSITGYTDGNQSTSPASGLGFRIGYTDGTFSSYTYWDNSNTTAVNKTFTTAANKTPNALLVSFASKGQNIWHLSKIQLELGSATAYEPYEGHSYTVNLGSTELCKIGNYQDYIYKSGSDWYVHKATALATLTGASPETYIDGNSNDTSVMFYLSSQQPIRANALAVDATSNAYLYSDKFRIYNCYAATNTDEGICYHSAKLLQIRINKSRLGEVSTTGLTTWLSSNNVKVYYVLATPTDTKITDATLIAQLDAVHQFLTRYGYNGTVSGNLPIIIDRTNL